MNTPVAVTEIDMSCHWFLLTGNLEKICKCEIKEYVYILRKLFTSSIKAKEFLMLVVLQGSCLYDLTRPDPETFLVITWGSQYDYNDAHISLKKE